MTIRNRIVKLSSEINLQELSFNIVDNATDEEVLEFIMLIDNNMGSMDFTEYLILKLIQSVKKEFVGYPEEMSKFNHAILKELGNV